MATVTARLVDFDNGEVRVELDYDDATAKLVAVRQINNSTRQGPNAVATRLQYLNADGSPDPTKKFPVDGSFYRTPAGSTDQANIPTNIANQLPLTLVNLRGRIVIANVSAESNFPVA